MNKNAKTILYSSCKLEEQFNTVSIKSSENPMKYIVNEYFTDIFSISKCASCHLISNISLEKTLVGFTFPLQAYLLLLISCI